MLAFLGGRGREPIALPRLLYVEVLDGIFGSQYILGVRDARGDYYQIQMKLS
jgi:hypothetical protein